MENIKEDLYELGSEPTEKEKAFGGIFKEVSQAWFKHIKEEFGYDVHNVEYGNGYFIFERGENSVVHFNIKQAPKFKFAIWFDYPQNEKQFYGEWQVFAQVEENIDKFKPSRSPLLVKEDYHITEDKQFKNLELYCNADRLVDFIVKEY